MMGRSNAPFARCGTKSRPKPRSRLRLRTRLSSFTAAGKPCGTFSFSSMPDWVCRKGLKMQNQIRITHPKLPGTVVINKKDILQDCRQCKFTHVCRHLQVCQFIRVEKRYSFS